MNQAGTKAFHLKAELAPSRNTDANSDRTGEIEIWWISPTEYRREVRSPEFHQISVVNGTHEWQKNEGSYFPAWLRETAVALVDPIPNLDTALEQVQRADVKRFRGATYFSWNMMSSDGTVRTSLGASISLTDSSGLLFYGVGLGWGGLYENYKDFHGRMIARTVRVGTPEITAKISELEDLRDAPADFFNAEAGGGDIPLHTLLVNEMSLRRNLLPMEPVKWPALQDGPLEGALSAEISVDREGVVREIGPIVGSNQGVYDAARAAISAMRFQPYLVNGVPVQVVSPISMGFKTARPAGAETFDSARSYFERGRTVGFPAAGSNLAYLLHATFQAKQADGTIAEGTYVDTWQSVDQWRREASIGESRYIRTQHGAKHYELAEGPDVALLRRIFRYMEPIPTIDTFYESDWKIRRDTVEGVSTIRLLAG